MLIDGCLQVDADWCLQSDVMTDSHLQVAEPPSIKTVNVYRDPCDQKRSATAMSWYVHPCGRHGWVVGGGWAVEGRWAVPTGFLPRF